MSTTLRISLTQELDQILSILQIHYPTLSRVELAKLAIGNLYRQLQGDGAAELFASIDQHPTVSEEESMQLAIQPVTETRDEQ
jgi:hypothetical protein